MNPTNRQRGGEAEKHACSYLQSRGLLLYDRNYLCRGGEIDLVMGDGDTLVFVEVRMRRSSRYGSAAETIGPRKQARIINAASHYLQTHPCQARRPARFDVILLQSGQAIEWIKDAFRI